MFPFTQNPRYDPGHDESLPPRASGKLVQDHDFTATVTNSGSQRAIQQQQQHQQFQLYQKAGTLLPSPEPQPAPIDRWARGWVVARSANANDWVSMRRSSTPLHRPHGLHACRPNLRARFPTRYTFPACTKPEYVLFLSQDSRSVRVPHLNVQAVSVPSSKCRSAAKQIFLLEEGAGGWCSPHGVMRFRFSRTAGKGGD